MTQKTDWLPFNRNEQLAMGKNWFRILGTKAEAWSVPEFRVTKLSAVVNTAESENVLPAGERNPVSNARLRTAFRELTAVMRDIKKRYFYNPPLTDADLLSLGLKPKDTEPTPVADPTGMAEASIAFPGRTQLRIYIKHVGEKEKDARVNYGCRIYYGLYAADATPPATGNDLRESRFTRRKKELFTFEPKDTGKIAYFCIRYENSKGKAGPWGMLTSALIP